MKKFFFLTLFGTALVAMSSCGDETLPSDAGSGDSGSDATVACTDDAMCNDNRPCNGVETCNDDGFCESGTPMDCSDGIACTLDLCSDTLGCQNPPVDLDGDGYGDANCLDSSGAPLGDDCDDNDINRFPDNIEFCDAEHHDEDCNLETFGAIDRDEDGFFDADCCNTDGEVTFCGNDCDDLRGNVNLSATEACDGINNDCDANTDEGVALAGFVDEDRDGHGDPTKPLTQCAGSVGFSTLDDDCDDANPAIHGGQLEICDGVNNDCDADIDEEMNSVPWYPDMDGDGFGDEDADPVISCTPVADHVLLGTDCNDNNAAINPSAAELCDGIDNDCDGSANFSLGENDFEDDDGDGLVDIRCTPLGIDCVDTDPTIGPGTDERCDGRDNDCDTRVDEDSDGRVWFLDVDGDGFGSPSSGTTVSCSPVEGFRQASGDCNDSDPSRFPGAPEVCNGVDDDCNFQPDDGAPAPAGCAPPNAAAACVSGTCGIGSCTAGFDDCDGNITNGCEEDLNLDPEHCGRCFNRCSSAFLNAQATCVAGDCMMAACNSPFGDCDVGETGEIPGCETILTSTLNCGGCDVDCTIPGGLSVCADGACLAVECPPGTDDCDMNPADCETDTTTTSDCGDCGRVCSNNNGTAQCVGEDCQIVCDADFDDCNGDSSDGCETDLRIDADHCGSCGFRCDQPNTISSCVNRMCMITGCIGDFEDCDSLQPGCETDTQLDPFHCGGCNGSGGMDCNNTFNNAEGFCNMGTCEMAACRPDWEDCMNGDTDGCETNTQFDPANCGGCFGSGGVMCNFMNGNGNCNNGMCVLDGCFGGFEDCNFDPMDGCEEDVTTDPMNCGGCGITCGIGAKCNDRQCDRIVEVTTGHDFGCAVYESGTAVCWGANDMKQLGSGVGTDTFTPRVVETSPGNTLMGVRSISAGLAHACAVTDTGTYCWGDNTDGQVGTGTFGGTPDPTLVAGPFFIQVAAGAFHTCGLEATGTISCWGKNDDGQLGNATTVAENLPVPIAAHAGLMAPVVASKIVSGSLFSCAIMVPSGEPTCWGDNEGRQLGTGSMSTHETVPQAFSGSLTGVSDIAAGEDHACLIRSVAGPFVECWGEGMGDKANGDAVEANRDFPDTLSPPVPDPVSLALGAQHSCAYSSNGDVYCWGSDAFGQLGDSASGGNRADPQLVGLGPWEKLSEGGGVSNHNCAVRNNNEVYCWGDNANSQLGVDPVGPPAMTSSANPVPVNGLPF